jgi:NitT/TauT family transport system ATP-binding protein
MDEPFAPLDAGLRADMQDFLRDEIEGRKLVALFVTHYAPEAVLLADRIEVLLPRPARIAGGFDTAPVSGQAAIYEAPARLLRCPKSQMRLPGQIERWTSLVGTRRNCKHAISSYI